MSYVLNVFCLCKLYIHVICFLSFVYVNCIYMSYVLYNLHRQKTKNIWHVYTICIDKRQKNIWHVYTIYTDKRHLKLYMHVICLLSMWIVYTCHMFFVFVYVNCIYMSYVLNVFFLCKLYIHVICLFHIDKRHMTCIYNLHRQKTYDMYIQFTQTKDKKHMTCIYN
jgi:hypothetical protein